MSLIYCQTVRTAINQFEFWQTEYVGQGSKSERVIKWTNKDNDRLASSIINIGMACRDLSETQNDIKIVGIESDTDGKDVRNGGEHNILFDLLNPKDDFAGRKNRSLYFEYERHLSRIMQLSLRHNIKFVLQELNGNIRYNN